MNIWDLILSTFSVGAQPSTRMTVASALLGVATVAIPVTWRIVRIVPTVVHETGHAVVGILMGRKVRGFSVSPDMSGETVTVGKKKGLGVTLTTFAGYPAPVVVGAVMVRLALGGRAQVVMAAIAVISCLLFLRSRSLFTLGVTTVLAASSAALWLWAPPAAVSSCVLASAFMLMAGGWRQWANVARSQDPKQDPAELELGTGIPMAVWHVLWLVLMAVASVTSIVGFN